MSDGPISPPLKGVVIGPGTDEHGSSWRHPVHPEGANRRSEGTPRPCFVVANPGVSDGQAIRRSHESKLENRCFRHSPSGLLLPGPQATSLRFGNRAKKQGEIHQFDECLIGYFNS